MRLTIYLKNGKKYTISVNEAEYDMFKTGFLSPDYDCMTVVRPNTIYGIVFSEITHWELSQ